MEIWKEIPRTKGYYEASIFGRIRSIERIIHYSDGRIYKYKSKIRSKHLNSNGYECVTLHINGKNKNHRVHQIIAQTFLGLSNGQDVNHKNSDRTDNRLVNLEYCSRSANIKHGYINNPEMKKGENSGRAILTKKQVDWIRINYKAYDRKWGGVALSKKLGVSSSTVHSIISNINWSE